MNDMRRLSIIAAAAVVLLAGCSGSKNFSGTGGTTSTGTGTTGTGTTGTTTYEMGNGTGSQFQSGMIGISNASVAAGGTTSLSVTVVDQTGALYTAAPVTLTFSSSCISQGQATIAASGTSTAGATANTVTSTTGTIDAMYTAKGCSGADVITASAAVSSTNLTATGTVTVASAAVGSIQFESATPSSIGLKGTGLNETSTVVFKVVDSSGGARPGVTVNFSLNTTAGGLSLAPSTATSGSDGTVQTVVSSGTEHTAVRVTATISSPALSTQSSSLSVTTGLPASNTFSIAVGAPSYGTLACPNVEAYGIDVVTVPVTVQLADRYNNPAPDGTTVTFTTNGGHIDGTCTTPFPTTATGNGICQVTWTSANPRPTTSSTPPVFRNGRATILATAIGEESFDDVHQTGYYEAGDPFSDLGEPYLDANESGAYVVGDYYYNFYNKPQWEGPSGTFKGITCSGATCTATTLGIGVSHLLIMSTSGAQIASTTNSVALNVSSANGPTSASFNFTVADLNGNTMAAGTTITATSNVGTLSGTGVSWTVGCSTGGGPANGPVSNMLAGGVTLPLTIAATATGAGNITITVTSPQSKSVTVGTIPVTVSP
jgi:hypothetical protein